MNFIRYKSNRINLDFLWSWHIEIDEARRPGDSTEFRIYFRAQHDSQYIYFDSFNDMNNFADLIDDLTYCKELEPENNERNSI